jgi:hypothetical protein
VSEGLIDRIQEECPEIVQCFGTDDTKIKVYSHYDLLANILPQKVYADLGTIIKIAAEIYMKYQERKEAQENEEEVLRVLNEVKERIDASADRIIIFLRDMRLQEIENNFVYAKKKWAEYIPRQEDYNDLKEIIDYTLKVYTDLIPEVKRNEEEYSLKAFSILSSAIAQRGMAILELYYTFHEDKRHVFSLMWEDFSMLFELVWSKKLIRDVNHWKLQVCNIRKCLRDNPPEVCDPLGIGLIMTCNSYTEAARLANKHLELKDAVRGALEQ